MTEFAPLAGRRLLVSGGESGIGRAFVDIANAAGAEVALIVRHDSEELASLAPDERRHAVDLANADATEEAAKAAIASLGGQADGLVASAGVFLHKAALETSVREWDDVLAINLRASFQLARACATSMSSGSSIVLVSSQIGRIGHARGAAYAASKAGVEGFVRSLALELAPRGIRVNAVAPGPIDTPMTAVAQNDAERLQKMKESVPLARLGTPNEVAGAIRYLLSDSASFITGHALLVDGGVTAG